MRPHFSRLIPCPPPRWLRVESRVHAREETTSRGNFRSTRSGSSSGSYRMITTTTTNNINHVNRTSASTSLNSSSSNVPSASAPIKRLTTRPQLDHPRRAFSDKVTFQSPFYQLTHCDHCYPATSTGQEGFDQTKQSQLLALGKKTPTRVRSNSTNTLETTSTNLVHAHQLHQHQHHPHSYNMSTTSSAPAPAPASASTSTTTTTKKPPTPGQGILVPASKVHTAVKTELLNTLSQPEFTETDSNSGSNSNSASGAEGKGKGRVPKLVGILATDKEDAASYAEFTRKSCTSLGITYELRLVGSARKDQGDQPGVEIGVEEAILEANEEEGVDGIMVYYPIHGGSRDQYLQQCVSPLKDVEGLHHQFLFNLYHNIRHISPSTLRPIPASHLPTSTVNTNATEDPAPPGTVKSILPCTPLAIVKVLEFVGVYNKLLEWGDRARGKVITVINRSEVVGRPLAALLANDGARVLSVDIDSIVEFSKRPSTSESHTSRYNPHHIMSPLAPEFTLQDALAVSDVVISAVPHKDYKVKTEWLKDGCICVNVAGDKNFEADVRDKASIYVPSVGQMTIAMLQRNLLRLRKYRNLMDKQEESPF